MYTFEKIAFLYKRRCLSTLSFAKTTGVRLPETCIFFSTFIDRSGKAHFFLNHVSPVGCTFSCERKMQDVQKPSITSEFFWHRWNLTHRNGGFSTLVPLVKFEYFLKLEIYNAYDQYLGMSLLKDNSYNWIIFYSSYYFLF